MVRIGTQFKTQIWFLSVLNKAKSGKPDGPSKNSVWIFSNIFLVHDVYYKSSRCTQTKVHT